MWLQILGELVADFTFAAKPSPPVTSSLDFSLRAKSSRSHRIRSLQFVHCGPYGHQILNMTLEDFEKELAKDKDKEEGERHHRHHSDRKSDHRHHRKHHHNSSRHHDNHDESKHRSKRRRHSRDSDDEKSSRSRRKRRTDEKAGVGDTAQQPAVLTDSAHLKRDSWMEAPPNMDIEYKRQKPASPPRPTNLGQNHALKIHEKELNHHLRDLQNDEVQEELDTKPANHEVDYTFGDAGSHWRMTTLKAVYRKAEETRRKVEEVALERYDSLREFDDAREEETELDRRKTYGDGYVGKEKPSGELFQERKHDAGVSRDQDGESDSEFDHIIENVKAPAPVAVPTQKLDSTALNKLKAHVIRAKLKNDPAAERLEREYEEAVEVSNRIDPAVVQLSAMDNRMLSSAPRNEVQLVSNRRGAERGQVEDNENMTIERHGPGRTSHSRPSRRRQPTLRRTYCERRQIHQ